MGRPEPGSPELWTDAFLDRMRETADPLADAVVHAAAEDASPAAVGRLLGQVARGGPDADLPAAVRRYLDETGRLPDWVDPAQIRRAQRYFLAHGPQMIIAAFCSSLPTFYSNVTAMKVFSGADLVRNNPALRVLETVLLMVDVLAPGGLDPDGRGIRASQVVRLAHAGVRALKDSGGNWDPQWGRPINQEDLAWQLLSLSRGVLDGMRRLGTAVSDEDETAVLHAWNAVGHVLGLDRRLMATTGPDAAVLTAAIRLRQAGPSPEGRAQTDALIETIERLIPGTAFDGVARALVQRLLDPGGGAGGGGAGPAGRLRGAMRGARERAQATMPGAEQVQRAFGRALVQGIARAAGGARASSRIPRALTEQWGVPIPNDTAPTDT